MRHRSLLVAILVALVAALTACGDSGGSSKSASSSPCLAAPTTPAITANAVSSALSSNSLKGQKITLMTHDSFALSKGTLDAFTQQTGVEVTVLQSGDAGQMVSQAVLTSGKPVADVMYGIDNTLLCKGIDANLFVPYTAKEIGNVDASVRLDKYDRVTPIDIGDVCVNFWKDSFKSGAPGSIADLTKPAYKNAFVTENPETSSPGLAFMLATIAKYGESGWLNYWKQLRSNGLEVVDGWDQAYETRFASGGGPKSIVTSYATSPAAEVLYSDGKLTQPPTGVLDDTCFRQVEFAGVLRGTAHAEAAAALVDFLLSNTVQSDIPLNMFVFPTNKKATIPADFSKYVSLEKNPLTMTPDAIDANRDKWTQQWTDAVLR